MVKDSYILVDALAQRDNVLTRMDARLKVILSVAALAVVIGLPGFTFSLGVLAAAWAAILAVRIPLRFIIGRTLPPLALSLVVLGLMLFLQNGQPLFTLEIAGFKLTGYKEGLILGSTILLRINASVSVLMFLSVTTPVHELGYALVWFRVPKVIVEILLLTYRYLFVLWDEGMRIRQAQTLRLGYPKWNSPAGWRLALKSTCTLMAMVFIRAYDRAECTFSAMQVRAYNGEITGSNYTNWKRMPNHYLISGLFVAIVIIILGVY
ncbi:MAG: cobalt ECF transporter T component CbiQ [Firmicutes bacterium HGW-Firmicutes-14]|nr:MAG: cobalt ECF transporter T component CbiQ [Firmicutes bacterium HGW-Firmicutes-14]